MQVNETNTLRTIKKMLDDLSNEYVQILNTFDKSTMSTESMEEEKKMSIRINALEIRCKSSQFLLENIITSLNKNGKGLAQIEKYRNQVSKLLSDIREELGKNNLLEMIGYLEEIPTVMSEIDNEVKAQIEKTHKTLH